MDVKVCDMKSDKFKVDFLDSIVHTGFAVVTNHSVSHDLIKETQANWRKFFLSSKEYKERFLNKADTNMGYKGFGSEKALGAKNVDLKEFYHWRPGKMIPLELVASTHGMYEYLGDVSQKMLAILDTQITHGTRFYDACKDSQSTILRSIYYPAMDFSATNGVRAAAHEDINFITLLVASSAPGLQVKDKNQRWHDVPHEENSIVVNIGDGLELASGGLFKSTTHRVINPTEDTTDRVSMPFFAHASPDTVLDYKTGTTAKQFLYERLNKIYPKA